MGNFVGVFVANAPDISEHPEKYKPLQRDSKLSADAAAAFAELIGGSASPTEEQAPAYIYALEELIRQASSKWTVQETYLDEDTTPQIWAFVWEAGELPGVVPLSPYGSPALGWWAAENVQAQLSLLEPIATPEVAAILEVLRHALSVHSGVAVFYSE
jgi:hypothetical protein